MTAYIVCLIDVTDPDGYSKYVELAGPAVQKNGGRFLARGSEVEALEGACRPGRVVIAAFDDMEAARRSYRSPEYQRARTYRIGAASFQAILVSGS
ncbi:DUF1330 domain-containing protein [Paraburkholderia silviterrae]|uniref:DUF1330 domain-containing protein n=1 Tax=Paraburkholderia silviterrae TaxID=2528715 RepID=A0A4R5M1C6_9BURK|nr:DUF1330 domain-containing protein [Paraburkholderia silviterrae]